MAKFFITTTIPYVNGDPHIGHALEFAQADVIARFRRAQGDSVFFLTGTDENSLKNVLSAEKAGVPVKKFVDEYSGRFKAVLAELNISNDDFIRTTEERHVLGAQKLWQACDAKGDIYKKKYRGLYCVGCEAFYLEKDLDNGLCPEHGTKPEVVEEENYFFRLSKYQKELERLFTSGDLKIVPEKRKNEALNFIREGLEDFSISRSNERAKNWGVPVPGDSNQIMYVWFDALSNYINAVGYADDAKRFAEWWGQTSSVGLFFEEAKRVEESLWPFWINPFVRILGGNRLTIVHVLGKGVARFHALYWPGMLLSAGLRLPREEFIHGYFTVHGEKMSKSIGNAANPSDLVKKYGTDAVRYFLLRGISAHEDGDFSEEKFKALYNADLANGIGNLVARVSALGEKAGAIEIQNRSKLFDIKESLRASDLLSDFRFNEVLEKIWDEVRAVDKRINDEKPWEKRGEGLSRAVADYSTAILRIAHALQPFLPETAKNIQSQFRIQGNTLLVKKAEPLFRRLP